LVEMAEFELLTGTAVGIRVNEGVVLATEKRVAYGFYLMSKSGKKVFKINDRLGIASAGILADMQTIAKIIRANLYLYYLDTKRQPTVRAAAKLLSLILFEHRIMPYICEVMVGGVDEEGSHLYILDPAGSMIEDNYAALGTGAKIAIGILESEYRPDMSLEEAKKLAVKAIRQAISRDPTSGDGCDILVISDRGLDPDLAPIPSLLATGAVHHHLIREKTRTQVGIVVESGDAREVHHMALLVGYGAAAVCPYVAFEAVELLAASQRFGMPTDLGSDRVRENFITACDKGIRKIMSKMGISTVASYCGAQIFEALGLGHGVVDDCFTGTVSRLDGVGYDVLAEEVAARHRLAFPRNPGERAHRTLEAGGEYQWRSEGEVHLFNPETVFRLQHATREGRYDIFRQYTAGIDEQARELATLRGLFRFRDDLRPPLPIDEVEPVAEIVKRFATGAMSYGSISAEAHETLAVAMNRIGAKSNTGEGGEDPERFVPDANGDLRRSAIKQVASGRFGVTSEYLVNADDLQIKMAQGAKPGEGGQLPGHKVYPWIAKTRHSTPGVGLISPPPHHDIYSIEDLAQLIHDLKNSNPWPVAASGPVARPRHTGWLTTWERCMRQSRPPGKRPSWVPTKRPSC